MHHFNEFYQSPEDPVFYAMFHSIWNQLSKHYLGGDHDRLIFEPLNEPHDNLTAGKWNAILPEILKTIRKIDTLRTLIIDVPDYGNHHSMEKLQIPDTEKNSIVSVRYYLPYNFTHQGAHWVEGSESWLGTRWTGTETEKLQVISDVNSIYNWAVSHNRPVTIGEFGSIINADNDSRVTWTSFVIRQFESHYFSWTYFDFGVLFKAYDLELNDWIDGFEIAFFGN
jgi:endoglucanase